MKIKLLFLFLILIPISVVSADHYYYQNRKIDLDLRADKIAVVLNNDYSELTIRSKISAFLGTGDDLKRVIDNIYLINFSEMKTEPEN